MHGTEEAVDGEGVVAEIAPKSRSDRKIDRLGTESTFKLLLEFSIPAVAGMLVQMLYNVIDAVYVGHAVGADGLAATTVANPMMTAMVAVAMLVGVGGNALAAIKLGERKKGVAERVMGNSFVLLVGAGVVAWIVGLAALDPILRASGADDAVLPHARAFMTVIIAGCPLQFVAFGMNNFIRTAGHPNRALGSMLVGTGANIVLGYLFIIVLDGGMTGAGLATVCSWALSAAFVMQFFLKKGSPMPLRREALGIKWRVALRICALGVAPSVMELGFAVSNMIMNNLLLSYGASDPLGSDGALAVMRVLSAVGMFTIMPSMGIAMGAQPIIGYNHGAMKPGRVLLTLKYGVLAGTSFTTLGFLACVFFPRGIAGLFTDDASLISLAANGLIICVLAFPLIGSQIIIGNFFQAIGKARLAIFLSLTRQMLFLLPFLLVLPRFWGQDGVWASLPLADVLSFIVTLLFIRRFLKYYRLKNRHYLVPGTGKA